MKSTSGVLLPRDEIRRLWSIYAAPVAFSLLISLILGLLILFLGLKALPIAFFLFLVFPWLMQDAFRLFIWLIITWPLLYLFVRVSLPAGMPDLSYDREFVLLLACVILLEAILSKRKLTKVTPLDILALIYVGAQVISRILVVWFGGTGSLDLNGLLDIILIPMVMYWVVKNLLVSSTNLKWFLYGLVIACLFICLTGLFEQFTGMRVFKSSDELRYIWQDVPGGRAAGAMLNPAIYGATLGMGALAGMCCLSQIKGKLTQAALVATIGILLYGVLASFTRSAWVSVFVVLFVAQFFISGLWKRSLPILVIGTLVLLLIWQVIPGISIIVQRALVTKTVTQRVDLLNLGWTLFLQKPFLGWGSGALNDILLRQGEDISSHNIFLTFLVDGGLVLFLAFCAFVGYLLIMAIRVYKLTSKGSLERNVLVAMTGSVLIYLLSGLALELKFFGYFNMLFWISAGVIDLLAIRCNSAGRSTA